MVPRGGNPGVPRTTPFVLMSICGQRSEDTEGVHDDAKLPRDIDGLDDVLCLAFVSLYS